MFTNTLLPRECFFAPLRFHSASKIRGQRAGTEERCVLEYRQGVTDA
jgi:hypothetical protein